jgi:signal transduction histidine kinase
VPATSPTLGRSRSIATVVSASLASAPVRILLGGVVVAVPLILLSLANAGGLRPLWDNLHWSLTSVAVSAATAWSVRGATGRVRAIRQAGAVAFALWMMTNLTWAWLNVIGQATVPSVADIFIFAILVPGLALLALSVRGRTTAAEEAAVYLDTALGFLLIATILILLHGEVALALPTVSGIVAMAYPTAFIGLGVAGLIALSAARYVVVPSGGIALAVGSIAIGGAYLGWIAPTVNGTDAGPIPSILFTVGTLTAGFGVATWNDRRNDDRRSLVAMSFLSRTIGPTVAGVLFLALLVPVSASIDELVRVAVFLGGALFVIRQTLLFRERTRMLAAMTILTDENARLVGELRSELERRAVDQRRMIQASRSAAVGELAAGVAHEVNNPLTGVLGFTELLLAETRADDKRRADLETIRAEAIRARDIVRALRDFANPRQPELTPTDISALVHQTVDLVRYSLERRGITIHEDLASLPAIRIDGSAIQQAVLNILTNARQAIPDRGHLEVTVRADGDGCLISITDDGVGMDATTARLAFDPFFSGREESTDVEPAAGLGLSVSHGLIESHGGTISIHSAPGRGTTVEIRLPAGDAITIDQRQGGRVL